MAGFGALVWCLTAGNPSFAAQRDRDTPPSDRTESVVGRSYSPVDASAGEAPAHASSFDIVVKAGRLVSGRRVLVVHRNDEVTLRITSDAADQFHLHGYNRLVELSPNRTATLTFKATLTGRFTYELHHADLELGALEVYP